ncbi:uncharacterized protein LOC117340829 [Pecten maximus]|uniref:uncharacterized protein LOC117340829 n=1 Tax=Pecten maximus TaxID=6579 RepID=UPI001458A35D|nr:uncharacterized protein LOC117340829 [Pecten maximus]
MTSIVPHANLGLSMPSVHTNIKQPEHLSNMNITTPLANVVSNLTGETNHMHPTIHSISRPLGMHVDTKIIMKFLADEFIDFGLLIQKSADTEHFKIQLHGTELAIVPKQKSFSIRNIEQWLSAFHVFVAIYVQTHPRAISSLMKHAGIVQTLHRRSGIAAALNYDCNFRQWHQFYPHASWGDMHSEFYLEATAIGLKIAARNQPAVQQPFPQKSANNVPKGICWSFNKVGSCRRGNYSVSHNPPLTTLPPPQKVEAMASQLPAKANAPKTNKTNNKLPTPIKVQVLLPFLEGYPRDAFQFLYEGSPMVLLSNIRGHVYLGFQKI